MTPRLYLFSAKNPSGHKVTDRVEARSTTEAVEVLTRHGLTEITLHDDDETAPVITSPKERRKYESIDPQTALKLKTAKPADSFWLLVINAYRKSLTTSLLLIALVVLRRVQGQPWGWLDGSLLALWLLPPIIILWFSRVGDVYRQVQLAAVEGRWNDVPAMLPRLERVLMKIGPKGVLEMAKWRAWMLIESGHADQAPELITSLRGRPGISESAIQNSLAGVYGAIPDIESAIACLRRATECAPAETIGWIGLAEVLAVHARRPEEARAALNTAMSQPIGDICRNGVLAIEGAIALGEGRAVDAKTKLAESIKGIEPMKIASPIAIGLIRVYQCLLAEALALSADLPAARREFEQCAEGLRRNRFFHLLDRASAAIHAAPVTA